MTDERLGVLSVSREEARAKIRERISAGEALLEQSPTNEEELAVYREQLKYWHDYNVDMMATISANAVLTDDYDAAFARVSFGNSEFTDWVEQEKKEIRCYLTRLRSIEQRLELLPVKSTRPDAIPQEQINKIEVPKVEIESLADSSITRTIYISDIQNSTARMESLSRDSSFKEIQQLQNMQSEACVKYSGKIIKGLGDGILVVFKNATDAVLAANQVHSNIRSSGLPPTIRIGIATGDVIEANGDVFGDAVNLASRICSICPPSEVYFSDSTQLAMKKAEVPHTKVGHRHFKGIMRDIVVYRVSDSGLTGQNFLSLWITNIENNGDYNCSTCKCKLHALAYQSMSACPKCGAPISRGDYWSYTIPYLVLGVVFVLAMIIFGLINGC